MSEFVRREPVSIQTEAGFGITLANLATSGANRLVLRLGDGEGWAAAAYPNRAEATRLRDELSAFLGEGGKDDARGAMVEAHQEIADELRQENAALRKALASIADSHPWSGRAPLAQIAKRALLPSSGGPANA